MANLKQKIVSKKFLVIILTIALIASGGFALYKAGGDSASKNAKSEGVNLNPPTKEDANRVEQTKQAIVDKQKQDDTASNSPQSNGLTTVKPTITYAGEYESQVEVGAYVSGIFEDGGTCTATFVLNGNKLVKQVQAVRGASSVNCPVMSIPASSFSPKGNWSATVAYSSATAAGTSDAKQVDVQ